MRGPQETVWLALSPNHMFEECIISSLTVVMTNLSPLAEVVYKHLLKTNIVYAVNHAC